VSLINGLGALGAGLSEAARGALQDEEDRLAALSAAKPLLTPTAPSAEVPPVTKPLPEQLPAGSGPHNLAAVATQGGIAGQVDARFTDRFQGLLDAYAAAGYPVRSISSYRPGDESGPHLNGAALDVNTVSPVPPEVQAKLARQFNLEAGVGFRDPDPGHFQVPLAELSKLGINGLVTPSRQTIAGR
jgi:hypothetical protein